MKPNAFTIGTASSVPHRRCMHRITVLNDRRAGLRSGRRERFCQMQGREAVSHILECATQDLWRKQPKEFWSAPGSAGILTFSDVGEVPLSDSPASGLPTDIVPLHPESPPILQR